MPIAAPSDIDQTALELAQLEGFCATAEGVANGVNGQNLFDLSADYSTTLMTFHS